MRNSRPLNNRACMIAPAYQDVSQLTSVAKIQHGDQYHKILYYQYGFDPARSEPTNVKELKEQLCGISNPFSVQVDDSSQYVEPGPSVKIKEAHPWTIDTVDEFDEIEQLTEKREEATRVRISEKPRVTVIAEKFTRFEKDNIEVRKLDTRIVCVEYDIYEANRDPEKPIQKMRAFFSVKPRRKQIDGVEQPPPTFPIEIQKRLNMSNNDSHHLSETEIEVIDSKVAENKPYVDGLRSVLKKKKVISKKKNKDSLDLRSMYEMAKRNMAPLDSDFSNTNLLSKAELEEVKELIVHECNLTTNNGVSRKKVRRKNIGEEGLGVQSESMFLDFLREHAKM